MAKETKYKLILHVNDKQIKTAGDTVFDCLKAIPAETIKTHGVFEIAHGKERIEKVFNIYNLRRIFANDLNKLVLAKKFELMLN